jgi:hypothetical protein
MINGCWHGRSLLSDATVDKYSGVCRQFYNFFAEKQGEKEATGNASVKSGEDVRKTASVGIFFQPSTMLDNEKDAYSMTWIVGEELERLLRKYKCPNGFRQIHQGVF